MELKVKKYLPTIFLCLIAFFIGSIWGKFNFITSNAFLVKESINVGSGSGVGKIPEGTELYFHSKNRDYFTYFAYIEVHQSESEEKIVEVGFDHYGGIKRLDSTVKPNAQLPR